MGATAAQYWLFQHSDSAKEAGDVGRFGRGQIEYWRVGRNRRRLQTGDVVFIWMSGEQGGLVGWGRVAPPTGGESSDAAPLVGVEVADRGSTIPRNEVRAAPELSDLAVVIQGQQGTAFAVSARQASGLSRLLADKGRPAPEISSDAVREGARKRAERVLERLEVFAREVAEAPGSEELRLRIEHFRTMLDEHSVPITDEPATENLVLLPKSILDALQQGEKEFFQHVRELRTGRSTEPPNLAAHPPTISLSGAAPTAFVPAMELEAPASFGIYRWWDRDKVGIAEGVNTLARYIAHKDLQPPRAIGIFGEWGSGKSFFMAALRSQIANLAWQAGRAHDERASPPAFARHILQIDFNAWHFAESNLWASLTAHILECLHSRLAEKDRHQADELFATLATAKAALEATERIKSAAQARIDALDKERTGLEEKVKTVRADERLTIARIADELAEKAKGAVEKLANDKKKDVQRLLGDGSLEKAVDAGTDLVALARETQGFFGSLAVEFRAGKGWVYVFAAVAIIATFLLPSALDRVARWLDMEAWTKSFATLGTYLTAIAAAVSAVVARGRRLLGSAREVQATVERARRAVTAEYEGRVQEKRAAVEQAESDLQALDTKLAKERDAVVKASAAIAEHANVGLQLKRFLEERIKGRTYEQHLGLTSIVRKDFERLSSIMASASLQSGAKDATAAIEPSPEAGTRAMHVPLIERIVLYIDDLDRCPPEKVVEVLQAVHLLLGFPLFVVVVGVDVRWIGRSLTKVYPELLADAPASQMDSWKTATADDYLEKIFQIPYRIPAMGPNARKTLLTSVLDENFFKPLPEVSASVKVPALEMNPREVELYPEERSTLTEFHEWLGHTPRRLRRFVDVYRLMRSGMAEGDVEALVSGRGYRGLLALFAILTSSPIKGPSVVARMQQALNSRRNDIERDGLEAWFNAEIASDLSSTPVERDTIIAILKHVDKQLTPSDKSVVSALSDWLPQVSSYTFREVRI